MQPHRLLLPLIALVAVAGCLGAVDDAVDDGDLALGTSDADAPDADAAGAVENGTALPPVRENVERSLQISDRWSGEPSIVALDDGTLLITGAGGFSRYVEDPSDSPGNFGQSYLWRSTDDGQSWTFVDIDTPEPTNQYTPYRNAVPGVEGDLSQDDGGRAYFVDLSMLATNGVSASDDSGMTWTAEQSAAGLPATDRPWIQGAGEDEAYVKYLNNGDWRTARSTDGGRTWLSDHPMPDCSQADMAIDRQAGQVLVPCVGVEEEGSLSVVRTPTGEAMDWERVDVPDAEGPASFVFNTLSVADEGHYVYAYAVETSDPTTIQVRVLTSTDAGETWQGPVTLSNPNGTAVFPWTSANEDGTVSVVWYETTATGTPGEHDDAEWYPMHARFTLDEDGSTAGSATVTRLAEEPHHEGPICVGGLGCVLEGRSDERRLLDFFEVDVDEEGAAHVTWTDTTTDVPTIWYGQVEDGDVATEPVN